MPYDKFFEVRPDNLATLLAFGGMVLEVVALRRKKKSTVSGFGRGLLYGIACGISKNPAVVGWSNFRVAARYRTKHFYRAFRALRDILLSLLTQGDPAKVWFILSQSCLLRPIWWLPIILWSPICVPPTSSFYGADGLTLGLLLNHAVWFIGIMMGVYRLLTPFLTGDDVLSEMLVGGIFLLSVFGYVRVFPSEAFPVFDPQ